MRTCCHDFAIRVVLSSFNSTVMNLLQNVWSVVLRIGFVPCGSRTPPPLMRRLNFLLPTFFWIPGLRLLTAARGMLLIGKCSGNLCAGIPRGSFCSQGGLRRAMLARPFDWSGPQPSMSPAGWSLNRAGKMPSLSKHSSMLQLAVCIWREIRLDADALGSVHFSPCGGLQFLTDRILFTNS